MKYRALIVTLIAIALTTQVVSKTSSGCLLPMLTLYPEARGAHSMAFDPYNDEAVIFGGTSFDGGIHSLGDTLTYSFLDNQWAEHMCPTSPPARSNHAMVYCDQTNEIFMYGGFGMTDTWVFSSESQTWSEVVTAINPGIHHSLALAYDPVENVVILFGGFDSDGFETDDTWMFDLETREWSDLAPATTPLARYGHVMVYDESINLIVMTSGNTASQGHQQDTWTFNVTSNTWIELNPTGDPDRLKWPSMTYDSINQKCILFGGQIGDYAVDRTWVYDGQSNTWQRRYPDDAPSDRINTGLAFDPLNNVTILFGGWNLEGGGGVYYDTWTYSYEDNVWTNVTISSGSSTTTTDTSPTPTVPNGLDQTLFYLIPSAMVIAAVVVMVVLIRRR
ncbi:MAG: Kelch repeat-containing protein [Candidatus Thorarchaeota archaeon]